MNTTQPTPPPEPVASEADDDLLHEIRRGGYGHNVSRADALKAIAAHTAQLRAELEFERAAKWKLAEENARLAAEVEQLLKTRTILDNLDDERVAKLLLIEAHFNKDLPESSKKYLKQAAMRVRNAQARVAELEKAPTPEHIRESIRYLKRKFIGYKIPAVELPADSVIEDVVRYAASRPADGKGAACYPVGQTVNFS